MKENTVENTVENIIKWFATAVPNPTEENACVQIGCHLEEVAEMGAVLFDLGAKNEIEVDAKMYKGKASALVDYVANLDNEAKTELLDALADQIVTACGVAYMLGMDIQGALAEVNRSNWSKFEDGQPVFDGNGKIKKGRNYTSPNLQQFVFKGKNNEN